MKILIIGNGFDLAHNLPTGYGDFLKAVDQHGKKNVVVQGGGKWSHSPELFHRVRKSEVYKYMKSRLNQNNGWVDFENELRTIVEEVCAFPALLQKTWMQRGTTYIPHYYLESSNKIYLSSFMRMYLQTHNAEEWSDHGLENMRARIKGQISDFIMFFKEYLLWMNTSKIPLAEPKKLFLEAGIEYLLSFNYTNTFWSLYNQNGRVPSENICYVHGMIDEDPEAPIVMGIGSDFYEGDKHEDFIECFKFFQRYRYGTSNAYQKWLPDEGSNSGLDGADQNLPIENQIYIYGHSLDPTDKDILLPFLTMPRTKITIFYVSDASKLSLEKNLVRILGRDVFSKYMITEKAKISFERIIR